MTEKKNILYLSYTGMTDPLGQSQVLSYLKGLSKEGEYQFTIISFEKSDAYEKLRSTIEEFCRNAGINWYPLPYTSKPPVISTFRDVRRMRQLAFTLQGKENFSLVHCRSYIASLVGLELKRKAGIPFIFDMRGFWADERIDGGIWNLANPAYKFIYSYFKKKERLFLQTANEVISLTQNAKDEILTWKLVPAQASITVIPCCVDFQMFNPIQITRSQKECALDSLNIPPGSHVISYLGTLGTWYMLPEMLAFAKLYCEANPNTFFMVLTAEPETLVLSAAVRAGFNTSYLRVKKVPRAEVPIYLSLSRASIFFIKPAFSKKASSPVKQGEIMAMGIPIVCNHGVGDTAAIIEATSGGVVVEDFTDEAFRKAILDLAVTHFEVAAIRENATKYFTLSKGVTLYRNVYEKILGDRQ